MRQCRKIVVLEVSSVQDCCRILEVSSVVYQEFDEKQNVLFSVHASFVLSSAHTFSFWSFQSFVLV